MLEWEWAFWMSEVMNCRRNFWGRDSPPEYYEDKRRSLKARTHGTVQGSIEVIMGKIMARKKDDGISDETLDQM